jgi:hypothetical protein
MPPSSLQLDGGNDFMNAKNDRADSCGVNLVPHTESEKWVSLQTRTIGVIEHLMGVACLDDMIREAKGGDDDNWLLSLLNLREDANEIMEELLNH